MDDLVWKPVIIPRKLAFGFEDSEPSTTAGCMEMTNISYRDYEDNYIEDSQNVSDTVLELPDQVDERGGEVYNMPVCHNSALHKLKENKYYPWRNEQEFWIMEWLFMKVNISHKAANALLQYMHRNSQATLNIRIQNVRDIKRILESASCLPPKWRQLDLIGIAAAPKAPQVYCRNVLEVVKYLFGNPMFAEEMHYRAEKVFDANGKRLYNEIWTSDWWWEVQSKLPNGATVIPIILNSDATQLDKLGHQQVHPMYITIGNIPKKLRRKSSRHAIVLLGYLPILLSTRGSRNKHKFKEAKFRTFHQALHVILEQLITTAKIGMMIPGPDGKIRRCFPILVSYSVDYPEACVICNIKQGYCVRCNIPKQCLHDLTATWPRRQYDVMTSHFRYNLSVPDNEHVSSPCTSELSSDIEEENGSDGDADGSTDGNAGASGDADGDTNGCEESSADNCPDYELDNGGMKDNNDIVSNYDGDDEDMVGDINCDEYHIKQSMQITLYDWNLTDIYQCMTPDKLHEIEKGVFGHMLNWFMKMIRSYYRTAGLEELDWRFSAIPGFTGLKHFSHGITCLPTVNAKDYRQIGKVILPIVSELVPDMAAIASFYHFLQWWYLIAKTSHSEDTIMEAEIQLMAFSKYVDVFKQYSKSSFNFPKFHSMVHYTSFISSRGSLDNFTTEHFEHQHILDAKIPFRHSNKKAPVVQMLSWISQRDIVIQKSEYLQLRQNASETAHGNTNVAGSRLGSPRKPERFLSIEEAEVLCDLPRFRLAMQSWVHNYLQNGIGKNGRLKRVRRSHLPKLSSTYVSNKYAKSNSHAH